MQEGRSILKHSPVYLSATILNRGVAFLLLLIYTHFLSPEEYGIIGLVMITSEIVAYIIEMQLGTAMIRIYFDYQDEKQRNSVISTAIMAMIGLILLLLLPLLIITGPLSNAVMGTPRGEFLFLGTISMLFNSLFNIGLHYLRGLRKSWAVMTSSTIRSIGYFGINIILVAGLGLGVWGALYGIMVANVIAALSLVLPILKRVGFIFSWNKLAVMLNYGLRLVPGRIAGAGSSFVERFIIVTFSSLSMTGIYYLAFRFGDLLRMIMVQSFNQIYYVHRLELLRDNQPDPGGPRIFTYFFTLMTTAALGLSLMAPEIIILCASPNYYDAAKLIPLLALAVVILSLTVIVELGILYEKLTHLITIAVLLMLFLHAPLSTIMIGLWGVMGVAIARCISASFRIAATVFLARNLSGPRPEWKRLAFILGLGILTFAIGRSLDFSGVWLAPIGRFLLVVVFPFAVLFSPIYDVDERKQFLNLITDLFKHLRKKLKKIAHT